METEKRLYNYNIETMEESCRLKNLTERHPKIKEYTDEITSDFDLFYNDCKERGKNFWACSGCILMDEESAKIISSVIYVKDAIKAKEMMVRKFGPRKNSRG